MPSTSTTRSPGANAPLARSAEEQLVGAPAEAGSYSTAAHTALREAQPHLNNEFKVPLAERLIAHTLADLSKGA